MNIRSTPSAPPAAAGDAANDARSSPAGGDRAGDSKEKSFGSALEKKASESRNTTKRSAAEEAAAALSGQFAFAQPLQANAIESKPTGGVAGALPPEVSALSGEIQHSLEVAAPNEVRIQFDAAVLDGLSVTLTREGGALQVHMQASSPEMARFLEAHASSLAQSLERPERAAYITVETRPQGDPGQGRQGHQEQQQDGQPQDDSQPNQARWPGDAR